MGLRATVVLIGVASSLAILGWFNSREPDIVWSPVAAPSPTHAAPQPDVPRHASDSPVAPSSASGQPAERVSEHLRNEFKAAQDLRAFAYSALTRPAEGGYFYARYAADICSRDYKKILEYGNEAVAQELRATGTVPAYHLQMMNELPRRCASFLEGEAGSIWREIRANAASKSDPLLAAQTYAIDSLLRKKDSQATRPVFEQLARLNDPLLWTERELYRHLVSADPELRKAGGFYFDGKGYRPDADEAGFHEASLALQLAFCGDGPCTWDDQVRLNCSAGGTCASDGPALLKMQYLETGGTEAGWRRILALASRARAGLETGDASMFVP